MERKKNLIHFPVTNAEIHSTDIFWTRAVYQTPSSKFLEQLVSKLLPSKSLYSDEEVTIQF